MEEIRKLVEEMIGWAGITGGAVPILRHILLTITAVLLAMLSDLLCRKLLVPLITKITEKTEVTWDDILLNKKVLTSACHIVPAVVIWSLMPLVYLEYPIFKEILERATGIYIVVMSVRTALVFIGSFKGLESSEERRSSAQQYFHTFCGVLRILMLFVAGVVVVAILLGKNPLTLFAGLGATSAVLMLVFKDTIEGLVAGIRLTSNEMMHIGDWITVPEAGADGTVVGMSLTTVKVRNFDNTIVTVSPKTLVDRSFRNWKGMLQADGRRVARRVLFDLHSIAAVTQQTAEKLQEKGYCTAEDLATPQVNMALYRRYMERFIAGRPEVNAGMQLMVRQLEPTPYGMPLEFYFFLHDKEWAVYEHQMAEIVEWAVVIAADFGLRVYEVASAEGPSGR